MNNNDYRYYVTPKEVFSLFEYCTIFDLAMAKEIANAWIPQYPKHPEFDQDCILAAIFMAGRIHGIRKERIRRKPESQK